MIKIIVKIILVSVLYISFSVQGLFEEKVYGNNYIVPGTESNETPETFRFAEPNINYFIVAVVSTILSGVIISLNPTEATLYSLKDKAILGALYTTGKMASEYSMRYLDFISKTIAKSIKSLSIVLVSALTKFPILGSLIEMIIGQKVTKNKTSSKDIFKGVISTLSLFLFSYQPNSHTQAAVPTGIYIGYIYLVISLSVDAMLALKEKLIKKEVEEQPSFADYKHMISWYTMFILNAAVVIITVPIYIYKLYVSDLFYNNLSLYVRCPELMKDLGLLYTGAIVGQVIVFQILERDGPLSVSIYTGSRKIMSIFLSIFFFEKHINNLQKISLLLGVMVMVVELLDKGSSKSSEHKHKQHSKHEKTH